MDWMTLFSEQFPHTDFSNVNLDWMIEQLVYLAAKVEDLERRVTLLESRE